MTAAVSWIWIRHAPVPTQQGRLMGQRDWPAAITPTRAAAVARCLPTGAHLLVSDLARARATADALQAAGWQPRSRRQDARLREQDLGAWSDRRWDDLGAEAQPFVTDPLHTRPPGGESFTDLMTRVAAVVREIHPPEGQPVVAVAHAGTIRAALAQAWQAPAVALTLVVAPWHLTRLTLFADGVRVEGVNQEAP